MLFHTVSAPHTGLVGRICLATLQSSLPLPARCVDLNGASERLLSPVSTPVMQQPHGWLFADSGPFASSE